MPAAHLREGHHAWLRTRCPINGWLSGKTLYSCQAWTRPGRSCSYCATGARATIRRAIASCHSSTPNCAGLPARSFAAMPRILVEHARAKRSRKRGGDETRVTLTDPIAAPDDNRIGMLVLDDALDRLQALDPRQAEIVELCYFGGLTYPEVGETLGISEATVHRSLRHARAWLRRELASTG